MKCRFQGVTHQQWYLFNDFLIEPIDKVNVCFIHANEIICAQPYESIVTVFLLLKTEAVQFDTSWKVPAILYYAKRNYHTKYDLRSEFSDTESGDFTCK